MGHCTRCGRSVPSNDNWSSCPMCNAEENSRRAAEERRKREQERKKEQEKRDKERAEAERNNSVVGSSTDRHGNVTMNFGSGRTAVKSAAEVRRDFRIVVAIIAIVVCAAIAGVCYLVYTNNSRFFTNEVFTETLTGDGTAVVAEALARDDDKSNWTVSITDYKKNFFGVLFKLEGNTATVKRYLQKDGTEVLEFDLDGYNFDTGLKGKYMILTIEGKISLLDEKAELIYREGSEFFDTNYPKLKAITYDSLLTPLTEKVVGDKYGKNEQYEHILQANGWQMAVLDEYRVEFLNETEDVSTRYVAEARNQNSSYTFEMLNYKLFDAESAESLDKLGKLLVEGDYSTSIEKYVSDKVVLDVRYERNLKQHRFEFTEDCGIFKKGIYSFTPGDTSVHHWTYNPDNYADIDTDYPIAENQELYDTLSSLVPETYLRNVMDLSKADKGGALGVTTYTMKNADGEKTAVLSLAFGKINKLIHYAEDGSRIEMCW